MAIENRNWAHIKHPCHVTIGPPRAPTLSGLAHCDGSLGVGEGRAQGATPLKVWRGFPQDSLSPSLKIRPEGEISGAWNFRGRSCDGSSCWQPLSER